MMQQMDVRIRATDFQLTPAVEDYAEERLMAIRHLLGGEATPARCEVELGRSVGRPRHGNVWFAEINLHTASGEQFFARAEGESVNAAIDAVKDEIAAQLRKRKKAARGMLKKGVAYIKRLMQRE